MGKYKKLSHYAYKCDYHIVWVWKYRFRVMKGSIRDLLESDIRSLCQWKGCDVEELNVQEEPCAPNGLDTSKG
jgi:putative transposase